MKQPQTLTQKRRARGRRGNALVESALVLWPFILIVFGLAQIGYVIWSDSTLAYAVDAGARYASLNGARSTTPATVDSIRQMVRDSAVGLETAQITVNVVWTPSNRPGSTVEIEAVYPVRTLVQFVWPTPFSLRSRTQMLVVN